MLLFKNLTLKSTHVAANHAAGQVADEEDDEDLTMMTAPSIQRLADAANLKSNITKPALHRTTSVSRDKKLSLVRIFRV